MKLLIADDEVPARQRLRSMLAEFPDWQVAGEAGDGREAIERALALEVDAVLLDIAMPVMDGLEAARHLARLERGPAVIFCTAYDEHALAAFEAAAIDYLVKPVRQERLREALERARRARAMAVPTPAAPFPDPQRQRTHLSARLRGNLRLIPVEDVHYLQAEEKYVLVHHARGEDLIEESLKALEQEFGERFPAHPPQLPGGERRVPGIAPVAGRPGAGGVAAWQGAAGSEPALRGDAARAPEAPVAMAERRQAETLPAQARPEPLPTFEDSCLVVIDGPRLGQCVHVHEVPVVIGRSPQADFRIEHPSVSRLHCSVWQEVFGASVRDLDSKNGVLVNGTRVRRGELSDGDHIAIGEVTLKFVAGGSMEARYHEALFGLANIDSLTQLLQPPRLPRGG
jgi:two-component system response regulator AlgR